MISILRLAVTASAILVAACSGGGGGAPAADPPLSARAEAAAVTDAPAVYAVEQAARVVEASIVTIDGAYTFAQVNSDIDPNDSFKPEVDAHFTADDYPADGLSSNARLRLRGSSSRLAVQKSYRVKLGSARPLWRGESILQLNKHPWDLTRVRNKLAFDLFRDIPHLPSLRTQFMHVTVNGQDYGLFTHVEKMGKEYLANRGLATDGNIYKANDFAFFSDPALALDSTGNPVNVAAFELVLELENNNRDHRPLADMIAAVNDETQPFETLFARYFDRNNYLTWMAVNILTGNRDTLNQNFALYQPKGTTKFYFLPWDYDGAFGFEDQPDNAVSNTLYAPWQQALSNWWGIPLHRRFLEDPQRLRELIQAVEDIYSSSLTAAKIQARLNAYRPMVEPLVLRSPDMDNLPTVAADPAAEWAGEYVRLATTVKKNFDTFKASLEKPMPFWLNAAVENGALHLAWDRSIDLQNDPVTYTIQVADNPDFSPTLFSRSGFSMTALDISVPPPGTYYLRVIASDNKGNTQQAFDRFDQGNRAFFGVRQFIVQ
jgi:spore coat protein H